MRRLITIFLLAIALSVAASADSGWYPRKINTGAELQTDAGYARNGEALVAIQTIPAAENSDDDQICDAYPGQFNATTPFVLLPAHSRFKDQPDVPRNIIVAMNRTTTCAMRINGTDISGAPISENLTWTSESGVKATQRAFKTISRIDATTTGATAQGTIGTGDALGLNTKLPFNSVLFVLVNGVRETSAPTVTTDASVLSLNTIDTATPPGGKETTIYYLVAA